MPAFALGLNKALPAIKPQLQELGIEGQMLPDGRFQLDDGRIVGTSLESIEDIEVLRFLELGFEVEMIKLSGDGIAVDVPEDIKKVETYLNEN